MTLKIYDMSGNLAEWTNDVDIETGYHVLRSKGFDQDGSYDGPCYSQVFDNDTAMANAGFRVVLYID